MNDFQEIVSSGMDWGCYESSEKMITFVATKKLYRFIGVTALNLGCALHFIFPEYEDQNI